MKHQTMGHTAMFSEVLMMAIVYLAFLEVPALSPEAFMEDHGIPIQHVQLNLGHQEGFDLSI
jgi:hypothetical protein